MFPTLRHMPTNEPKEAIFKQLNVAFSPVCNCAFDTSLDNMEDGRHNYYYCCCCLIFIIHIV